jgi:hypothetical protein
MVSEEDSDEAFRDMFHKPVRNPPKRKTSGVITLASGKKFRK